MVLALFVYIVLFVCMFLFSMAVVRKRNILYQRDKYWSFLIYVPMVLFSLVLGLRYNVGEDYLSYMQSYQEQFRYGEFLADSEYLFVKLNELLYHFDLHYCFLFICVLFIQMYFFYKTFEEKTFLLPYAVISFFITGILFENINLLRQGISAMILLYAIRYIYSKKFIKYFVFVFVASLFHVVSWLFLPFYLMRYFKFKILDNVFFQLFLFFATLFGGDHVYDYLYSFYALMLKSILNVDENWIEIRQITLGTGMGVLLKRFSSVLLIFLSDKVSGKFGEYYKIYYRIFFCGLLMTNMAKLDMFIHRISSFLSICSIVVIAYLIYYYLNFKVDNVRVILFVVMISIYVLLFFSRIYTGASLCFPFQFVDL